MLYRSVVSFGEIFETLQRYCIEYSIQKSDEEYAIRTLPACFVTIKVK